LIVVETQGMIVEAVNLGQTSDRTVNTVVFDGSLSRDDLISSYSNVNVYKDGNVSGAFEAMLDSLSYTSGNISNPGGGNLTLTSLIPGNEYLVQLFVSDDRGAGVATRTQNYTSGGSTTPSYENGLSYSLVGTFTAIDTTQDIDIKAWPGVGQTASSAILNAFQVRDITGGAPLALMGGGGIDPEVASVVASFDDHVADTSTLEAAVNVRQAAVALQQPLLRDLAFDDSYVPFEFNASPARELTELTELDEVFASLGDAWSLLGERWEGVGMRV